MGLTSQDEKYLREEMAFEYLAILARPVSPHFAEEMVELWQEYAKGDTEAAILVRSIDKLECLDQALVYEQRMNKPKLLQDFVPLESKIQHPGAAKWCENYRQEREDFWSSNETGLTAIFVIGGPGSGKGTQCEQLASSFDCLHLSVGDLLREEAADPESPYAHFINRSIENSIIIPAHLTLSLIEAKTTTARRGGRSPLVLLDGFPRSMEQLSSFREKVSFQPA